MTLEAIATSTTTTPLSTSLPPASDLILSIRDRIPDPVNNVLDDGGFKLASLIRWLNEGMRLMCGRAPLIVDWYALASTQGMDLYEMPSYITTVEQLWYDNWPCRKAPELDALFVTKITQRSYYFGPHSFHIVPRLHVWPCADRTSASTTLTAGMGTTDTTVPVTSTAGFRPYGFFRIDDELILYRTIDASTTFFNQILRGQGGTTVAAHSINATVKEQNIMFKGARLPRPINSPTDIVEMHPALWPVVELYVLSCARDAEQEFEDARALRQEFDAAVEALAAKSHLKYAVQGLQVREIQPGPLVYFGRTIVP